MRYFFFFFILYWGTPGVYAQQLKSSDYNANIMELSTKIAPVTKQAFTLSSLSRSWDKGIKIIADGSQTALSNWAAGGLSSIAFRAALEAYSNYQKGYIVWHTNLSLGYGILKQAETLFPQKTDDRLELVSSLSYTMNPYHSVTTMLNFKTQFTDGYSGTSASREKISSFFAPGYFILSLGWTYHPSELFRSFVAPLSGRFTFLADTFLSQKGAFGVEKGKLVRSELGTYARVVFEKSKFSLAFLRNVSLKTVADLYFNYLNREKALAFTFENSLIFKVNNYISCLFNIYLIYDQAVRFPTTLSNGTIKQVPKLQFKEILGIGFVYDFAALMNKPREKKRKNN